MSVYWVRVGPVSNMTHVLIIKEIWTQRQMHKDTM